MRLPVGNQKRLTTYWWVFYWAELFRIAKPDGLSNWLNRRMNMTIYEFTEWRYRLGLSQEASAELLGVHKDSIGSWELGNSPIEKQTQLATLACELAYIAADQYVNANPSTLNNIGSKNYVEHHGKRYIRNGIINGRNPIERELSILLAPKSLIHYKGKRS